MPGTAGQPAGPVALVGSGEYLEVMREVDLGLLAGRPPRAVYLPTAAAEEGEEAVQRWLELGAPHFAGLGVEGVPLRVLDRVDADRQDLADLVDGAGLVYLSGGNPGYLAATLRGTRVWAAIARSWRHGTAVAGCSAGACALSWAALNVRVGRAGSPLGIAVPAAATAPTGLALIDSVAVIPHFDRIVEWVPGVVDRYAEAVPEQVTLIGIDEDTAIITDGDTAGPFRVTGRQAAWVIERDGSRTRFGAGDVIARLG